MITTRQAVQLHADVEHIATRLSDAERDQLAKAALTLGQVRSVTLSRDYWAKALQILTDLAPSLADELGHLIDTVEEIHQRLPAYRNKIGNPT